MKYVIIEKAYIGWQTDEGRFRTDAVMSGNLRRQAREWIREKRKKRKEAKGATAFWNYENS